MRETVIDLESLADETIDEWLEKQGPWPLHVALLLLSGADPSENKTKIREYDRSEHAFLLRALDAARWDIQAGELTGELVRSSKPRCAADYVVQKKAFIRWAHGRWPSQTARLWDRLQVYDARTDKPSKKLIWPDRDAATKRVFRRVVKNWSDHDWRTINNKEIYHRMRIEASKSEDI